MVTNTGGFRLPRLLHPSLQANVPTGLFDLQRGRVCLFSAQSFGEVSGILSRQAACGRKTGRAFRVAQGVTLCGQHKKEGSKRLLNLLKSKYQRNLQTNDDRLLRKLSRKIET